MWNRMGKLSEPGEYEMFGVLGFLQHVPDRDRAREVFGQLGPLIITVDALRVLRANGRL